MAHSPFDSAIFSGLFGDPKVSDLLSDQALIQAMQKVEGHLALAQGELGVIPKASASAIFKASGNVTIDPSELREGTIKDGIPVPSFVRIFRQKMAEPEHAQYLHWGATSQDIMDTALILQLRDVISHIAQQILQLLSAFAQSAQTHRRLPMAARTRNQVATPTSYGARLALWGSPFLRHLERLVELKPRLEVVSFAGASGTLSALGDHGPKVADELAKQLGLGAQRTPNHAARDSFAELGYILDLISGSLEKFGKDLLLLGQSELQEVRLGASGGSSTMPHKSNPVGPETIASLARVSAANASLLRDAMAHGSERDGGAWAIEWHALPQLIGATSGALKHGVELAKTIEPDPARMMAAIEATNGLMFAEAASFALAGSMPRPDAQDLVKTACAKAVSSGAHLKEVLAELVDIELDQVFSAEHQLGSASLFADRFAQDVATAQKSFKF